VPIPQLGDSVTEGTVEEFVKSVGDYVEMDEIVGTIETDKASQEIRAPEAGVLTDLCVSVGDTVQVGDIFFKLDTSASAPVGGADSKKEAAKTETAVPKPREAEKPKEAPKSSPAPSAPEQGAAPSGGSSIQTSTGANANLTVAGSSRVERRVPMSRMRKKIAERLKDAQNTNAMLTTFNEIDMGDLMDLRKKHKESFEKKHGVKLGFMSAFVRAATIALQDLPAINAVIDGDEIVYREYVDISVAVATPKGLVVPVLRDCQNMSFADVEHNLNELAVKARDGKLSIEEMTGGTFTISNGGVFGSLMGTPIINPPQSAIMGMHATNKKPVVRNDEIVIRPMMYVALTYDHRLVDGREAATFLVTTRNLIQDPAAMLLQ